MSHRHALIAVFAASLLAPALSLAASPTEAAKGGPAQVKAVDGTKLKRLTLTQKAADRLDIQTAAVGQGPAGGQIAPYSSIFYDLAGEAWVYTNPETLTFVRHAVVIDTIKGRDAFLTKGPPVGTQVVTVGVSELYGTEKGVGH